MKYAAALAALLGAFFLIREFRPKQTSLPSVSKKMPAPPQARTEFKKIALTPPPPPAIRDLIRQGNTDEAISRLKAVLANDPANPMALMTLGNLYFKNPKYQELAESLFKKALDGNSENREALEKFLALQSRMGRSAIESLNKLVKENPNSPNIASAYARSMANAGRHDEAMEILERAIENPDSDAMAFHSLSEFARKLGDPGRAVQAIERAIERQEEALARRKEANTPTQDLERAITRSQAFLVGKLIESRDFERAEIVLASLASRAPQHESLPSLRTLLNQRRG